MNMARKLRRGEYQIGIWYVRSLHKGWTASATGALGTSDLAFPTLAAAHLQLTGEPMREAPK